MARHGQRQIIFPDTNAIVFDTDTPLAALLDFNLDGVGLCINAVFQQLFDHRGRPLNDFTSGNLVDKLFRQNLYGHGALGR